MPQSSRKANCFGTSSYFWRLITGWSRCWSMSNGVITVLDQVMIFQPTIPSCENCFVGQCCPKRRRTLSCYNRIDDYDNQSRELGRVFKIPLMVSWIFTPVAYYLERSWSANNSCILCWAISFVDLLDLSVCSKSRRSLLCGISSVSFRCIGLRTERRITDTALSTNLFQCFPGFPL